MGSELAVVGGGVIGLTVAWRMAREGWSVRLFERDRIGASTSSVAGGMLGAQAEAEEDGAFFRLCLASRALYPGFARALQEDSGIDPQWRSDGTLLVAFDEDERVRLQEAVGWQTQAGGAVEGWTAEQVRQEEPALSIEVAGAVALPDEGQVNSPLLVAALRQAALQKGVRLHEGESVLRIEHDGHRVLAVHTACQRYPVGRVLVAAGCGSHQMRGLAGEWMPVILPVKGQVVVLETGTTMLRRVIRGAGVYLIPRLDGRLIVGATMDTGDCRQQPTAAGVLSLLQGVLRLAPGMASSALLDVLVGFRPVTADRLPVLGPTPVEGLALAVGHFRNGILLAPITADLLCEFWTSARLPSLMRPFTVDAACVGRGEIHDHLR